MKRQYFFHEHKAHWCKDSLCVLDEVRDNGLLIADERTEWVAKISDIIEARADNYESLSDQYAVGLREAARIVRGELTS